MTFERTTDWALVKSVLTQPLIFDALHDDDGGTPEEWEPIDYPSLISYVTIRDASKFLGVVIVSRHSRVLWEVHVALYPYIGWKLRLRAARAFLEWIERAGCRRVIGKVPAYNKYAIAFNRAAGMNVFGINHKAFLKHNMLHDEIWFGLSLGSNN